MIKQDYAKVIEDFTEVIRLDPATVHAYFNRGLAWQAQKEHDKAIADYTDTIRMERKHILAYANRGDAWLAKQDLDKAIADFSEVIRLDPKECTLYWQRGQLWTTKKDHDQAIADYSAVIRLDANHVQAHGRRAASWLAKKIYDSAIADYSAVIRCTRRTSAPTSTAAMPGGRKKTTTRPLRITRRRSVWIRKMSMPTSSAAAIFGMPARGGSSTIADYSEVIRLEPNHVQTGDKSRGTAWLVQKGPRQGDCRSYRGNSSRAARSAVFSNRGYAWMIKQDYAKVIEDFTEVIRLDPATVHAYFNRGLAWQAQKGAYKAIADYTDTIRLEPKHILADANRGDAPGWPSRTSTRRSPISPKSSASTRKISTLTGNAASSGPPRRTTTRPSPITPRSFALIRTTSTPSVAGPRPGWPRRFTARRLPILRRYSADAERRDSLCHRGDAWRAKKDDDKAAADFSQAIGLDPKMSMPIFNAATFGMLEELSTRRLPIFPK